MKRLAWESRWREFLSNPENLPGRPRSARLVETHASFVVLTPHRVYKIKKPVDLGFLDFSTLAKRHAVCAREIELNRRLCPGVHLGLVAITRFRGRLAFAGRGKVVEWVIEMRRLPAGGFLQARLARGMSPRKDLERLAERLQTFYAGQTSSPAIARWGTVPKLRLSTNENFRQCRPQVGSTLTSDAFAAVQGYTRRFYRVHASFFARRVREGHILDGHGDLRLEHVHLDAHRVAIYDCIEFNDRFRYLDVANEAAFLAMDLDFHGHPQLADHFVRTLSVARRDPGMLRLVDFYKCYRAVVRGKVEGMLLQELAPSDPARPELESRARRYFQLALRYAVAGSSSMVLVVMGRAGSGKSTLAAGIAAQLGWRVFSADRLRKELAGVPLHHRGSPEERARLYARRMSDRTYAALAEAAGAELERTRAVVLDATFSSRQRRQSLLRKMRSQGARVLFLEVQASKASVHGRLTRRNQTLHEISDARVEDLPVLDRLYEPPKELDRQQHAVVRSRRTAQATLRAALLLLAERRADET